MSGFLTPPAFTPPVPSIPLGTTGQVLTMSGGKPQFETGGGGGFGGSYLAFASPAGASNNVAPTGFGAMVGLLDVTLGSGSATWTGLQAGTDRQQLVIANADETNNLTLASLNGASLAANQFRASGDVVLPPLASVLVVYYATPGKWIIA
jgi:hypothetical protein